jgi:hypothetical protein
MKSAAIHHTHREAATTVDNKRLPSHIQRGRSYSISSREDATSTSINNRTKKKLSTEITIGPQLLQRRRRLAEKQSQKKIQEDSSHKNKRLQITAEKEAPRYLKRNECQIGVEGGFLNNA